MIKLIDKLEHMMGTPDTTHAKIMKRIMDLEVGECVLLKSQDIRIAKAEMRVAISKGWSGSMTIVIGNYDIQYDRTYQDIRNFVYAWLREKHTSTYEVCDFDSGLQKSLGMFVAREIYN